MTYPVNPYDLPELADASYEAGPSPQFSTGAGLLRRPFMIRLIAVAVVVLFWQYFVATNDRMPNIDAVLSFLITEISGGEHGVMLQADFWGPLWLSVQRYVIGLVVGIPLGAVVGILIGRSRLCRGLFNDTTLVMLSLPAVVWAFLSALWFGLTFIAPVVAVVATAAPFMAANVSTGVRGIDAGLVVMSKSFRVTRKREVLDLLIMGALPSAFTGVRLAFVTGWNSLLIVEWFGAASGVGHRARFLYSLPRYDGFVAWILLFVVLITILDRFALKPLERRWSQSRTA